MSRTNMDIEYGFKVRLSEVSAKFSTVPEGVLAAGSTPFFRCNFDGKLMQSENCSLPGDPVWTFRNAFEYRLLEPGIDSLVASLAGRVCTFEVFVSDGSRQALVGRCAVDLLSVATGAHKFQLRLTPDGTTSSSSAVHNNAVLSFNLSMEQQSVVHLKLQDLCFGTVPTPTATKLHYLLLEGGSAIETSVLAPTTAPYFEQLPAVQCRTSLRALLATSVRITLLDAMRGDTAIGTLDLPLSEILLSADVIGSAQGTFKKNLYSSREYYQSFTALVTGTVSIERLPAFAQLANGQNIDGEISGKPLLPSCFLPPRYVKRPSRLPDYKHGPTPLAVSSDNAAGSAYSFAKHNSGNYIPAQVSQMPAMQSPQRRIYEPGVAPGAGMPHQHPQQHAFRSPHRPLSARPGSAAVVAGGMNNTSLSSASFGHHNHHHQHTGMLPRSPVAIATEHLIEQQDDASFVIEQQSRKLSETRKELMHRIHDENVASQLRLDELASEEHAVKEKLSALGGQLSFLHQQLEDLEAEQARQGPTLGARSGKDLATMEVEVAELHRIHDELSQLAANLRLNVEMDGSLRRSALDLVERSREQLRRDATALVQVENRVVSRLRADGSARSAGGSSSIGSSAHSLRDGDPRQGSSAYRTVSPPRPGSTMSSAGNSPRENQQQPQQQQLQQPSRSFGSAAASNVPPLRAAAGPGAADSVCTSPSRGAAGAVSSSIVGLRPKSNSMDNNNNNTTSKNQASMNMSNVARNSPSRSSVSAAAINASATAAGMSPVADPAVQAMNSAIVSGDVASIWNLARASPRAVHPRSLLLACTQRSPSPAVVEALLDLKPQLMQMTDASTGRTALHCACAADMPNAEVVRQLLDNGASVTEYDAEGLSAFHVALLNCGDFGNILRHALLDYGANVNQPTQGGCSPALLLASADSHIEALVFLHNAGADVNAAAPDQKRMPSQRSPLAPSMTPLQKAERCGAVAVRRFLLRHTGDLKKL